LLTEKKKKEMHCSLATNISTLQIQYERGREMREEEGRERERTWKKEAKSLLLFFFMIASST
jgi:hypothetical protein